MASNTKGGKSSGKDIKMQPGQPISKDVIVDVGTAPLHIIGTMPEGHTVSVFRVYNGDNECLMGEIPEQPVMCKDGCSPLMLFNEQNPECPSGRFIQSDIWLFYQGRYRLQYNHPTAGATEIPEDVYVWAMEDTLVPKTGINLPLCGENQCPPDNFCIGGPSRQIQEGDVLQICENGVPQKVEYVNPDTFVVVRDNGNNTYTAVNVDGTEVTWIGDTFGNVTDNGDGTITICNPDGSCVTFDRNTFTSITDNGDGTFTSLQPNNVTQTWVGTDRFMTIVENPDGTFTGTNVNGNQVIWYGNPSYIADGLGVSINGAGTQADPQVIDFAGCELPFVDQPAVDAASDVTLVSCLDGASVRIPLPPVQEIPDSFNYLEEGLGIDIDGTGTSEDPQIISFDGCELPVLSQPQVEEADVITLVACVDGQSVRIPYSREYPGPTGTVNFTDTADCSAIEITFDAESHPSCYDPGITQIEWWITDSTGTTIEGVNSVSNPTLPLTVTVDMCVASYPITAYLLATDACGRGGDASGNGLPATEILEKDLPIARIAIPDSTSDVDAVVFNASASTPSDGSPGGQSCPTILNYEYRVLNAAGTEVALITTGATGTAVNSGTHPWITGGTAEAPIVDLSTYAGERIRVELLVTDCNGKAGRDNDGDGVGNEGDPAVDTCYLIQCEQIQVRDSRDTIPSETFTVNDFGVWNELTPMVEFETTANGTGSNGGSITIGVGMNDSDGILVTGGTRIRLEGSTSSNDIITVGFSRPVCRIDWEAYDVDVAFENLTWPAGSVVSITPPYGNEVSSTVRLENLPNNTGMDFQFTPDPSYSCVIDVLRVETCEVLGECFAATRCTSESGVVTIRRNSNNQIIPNQYAVVCPA